jgi:hypothetical protein
LNQEDINNLNRSIRKSKIKTLLRSLQRKKNPGPEEFTAEFCQAIKEELVPMLLKLFCKTEKERTPPKSFYDANITLMPKLNKDTQQKENYRPISLMNIYTKILKNYFKTEFNNTLKRYTMIKLISFHLHKDGSTYTKQST